MIRLARIDEVRVVVMFLSQSEEFPKLTLGHDVERIIREFTRMMKEGRAGILVMQDERGWLQGGLLFIKTLSLYGGEPVAMKTSWYVAPKYRGKGMSLVHAFEKLAKELGCKKVVMSHLPGKQAERIERIYKRRGYKPIDIQYVKEV
jgi:GNAT superfamily N-acetyltransferase